MKKLLASLLTIITIATPVLTVIACGSEVKPPNQDDDYDIAVAINKTSYDLNVVLFDTQAAIKKLLTAEFIKSKLDSKLQTNFNNSKLVINNITCNNHDLIPQDLNQVTQVETVLTLHYSAIKIETRLTLKVNDQYQNQVIKAIQNTNYQYTNDTNSTLDNFKQAINLDFITSKFDKETKSYFQGQQFKILNFQKDSHELVANDFKITGEFYITVNFQYYDASNNFTIKMFLNPTINNQISNAICNTVYSNSIIAASKVDILKTLITTDFIKDKLSPQYQKQFINQNWKLVNLLKNDKSVLKDNDLLVPSNLAIIIQFTYDEIQGQSTLELNINKNADSKMVEAIENINLKYFWLTVPYRDAQSYFTADFIKQQLSLNMQKEFQTDKYQFIKLDWTGMDDGRLYYIYKLHFSYNNQMGVLPFIQATDLFSRGLADENMSKLKIKSNSTIQDLTNLFWTNYKKFVLEHTNPQYKDDYQFVIDNFNLQLLAFLNLKQHQLTDNDLTTKGTISIFAAFMVTNAPMMMPFQVIIN